MSSAPDRKHPAQRILILACAGGSNLGQIANQAAVELAEENLGRITCVASIAARVKPSIQELRKTRIVLAIEGCDCRCVSRVLKDVGCEDIRPVVVSSLGIEKRPGFFCPTEDVERVKEAVRRALVGE